MRAQAAVHFEGSSELQIREIEVAEPGPGTVLVKLGASGVCGSDRHVLDGDWQLPSPTVMGHEGAGEVVAIGEGVIDVEPGDHVILSWFYPCRRCTACLSGRAYVCTGSRSEECVLPDGTTPLALDGEPVYPYLTAGTMSEYAVVPESAAIKVPKEVPYDVASLIGCSIATGVGTVVNDAEVDAGESAVVVGAGGVGLSIIMGLQLVGANPIIAVDLNEDKLSAARELGATHTIVPGPDLAAQVAEITGGGAEYAFEAIGRVQTIESLPGLIAPGGTAVIVGLPPADAPVSFDALALAETGKRLIGTNYGSTVPGRDFPKLAALFLAGRLPVDKLISERIQLSEVNEAFDAMRRGERARSVIVF
ncbi:S-(hydroxymethyl)glutathione dehydrogenase/alcohol dehydrogenase [Pseudoclavibacter sp. JAI123]|uniref:alcohol dehydrogenase catalytic domain-containing protein n=1 Tax=Pseudoclavibacter sp. JAI123 TaxID=2723065 RepID=UPI0015CA80BA|nr:alcohol dehydrogenase catalytic domain-containing protein [Pseudoclavibacter sp. JAI123]NYF11985.1 S-(hydroxymethyl)glutathione dehydrogenase/alcohol dehydrogenase [Pseudoclavibacter sp. JAI123]